jgi:hypothetical protein
VVAILNADRILAVLHVGSHQDEGVPVSVYVQIACETYIYLGTYSFRIEGQAMIQATNGWRDFEQRRKTLQKKILDEVHKS